MLRVTPIYGSSCRTTSTPKQPGSSSSSSGTTTAATNVRDDHDDVASNEPSCTLIEYGGARVLVNIGWDDSYTVDQFPEKLPDHDALLITDSTLGCIGALPLYYKQMMKTHGKDQDKKDKEKTKKKGSKTTDDDEGKNNIQLPKIYTTFPTLKMGQMTLYDYHASLSFDGIQPPFTLEDIDNSTSILSTTKNNSKSNTAAIGEYKVTTLKYAQTVTVSDPVSNKSTLKITPNKSGHVIGNAFYILQRIQDETIVVVTNTYCIGKELHLDSATLLKYGSTPDVLITKPGGQGMRMLSKLYNAPPNKYKSNKKGGNKPILQAPIISQCEKNFIEKIMAVLRRDGNVLCPVDASGRIIELLLLLERHWDKNRLQGTYNICWVGPMSLNVIEYVKSQLEWMSKSIGDIFSNTQQKSGSSRGSGGGQGRNPFTLRNIQICTTAEDVTSFIESNNNNPTIVLASGLTMDNGPSRDLLLKFYDNQDNAIILTDSSQCILRNTNKMAFNKPQQQQQQQDEGSSGGEGKDKGIPTSERRSSSVILQNRQSLGVIASGDTAAGATAATSGTEGEAGTSEANQEDMVGEAIIQPQSGVGAVDNIPEQGGSRTGISEYCTAGQLLLKWCQSKLKGEEMEDVVDVDVFVPTRGTLIGQELQQFMAQEEAARLAKKAEEERLAMLREVERAKSQLHLGEQQQGQQDATQDIGGGTETSLSKTGTGAKSKTDGSSRPKKKTRFDSSLFLKYSRPLHLTFEVVEEAVGLGQSDSIAKYGIGESVGRSGEVVEDEYGISVKPEKFVDVVTGVDPSRFLQQGASGRLGDDVVRRGFGFGIDGIKPGLKRSAQSIRNSSGGGGIPMKGGEREDDDDDDEEEMDEKALEAADLSEGKGIIRGRNGRPPMKVSTVPRRLQVYAEVDYVPLEGRVDSRSARQSIRALQPRQVVVLGGNNSKKEDGKTGATEADDGFVPNEVELLAEAVRSHFASGGTRSSDQKVYTPSDGETAELNVGHAAYSVRLVDTAYQTREEKEAAASAAGEDGIALPEQVETFEAQLGECTVSLLDLVATGQKVALDGSIVLAPKSITSQRDILNQPSVYLSNGDVLLTDLRQEIIAQGMKAEYTSHVGYSQLVVNGKIIVKKESDTGKINVEGPLCEDFFTVRSVVCNQYVTL